MKHLLKSVLTISAAALAAMSLTMCGPKNSKVSDLEHTLLQSSRPWDSLVDIRCDIAMVYGGYSGRNGEFNKHNPNIDGWKERGYKIFWMKGISWGHEDYYFGRWDGQKHLDEYQIVSTGDTVTYHQVPTQNYIEYLKKMLKAVIDDGVDVLFFEEPEFTSRAGYSEAFKRAWKEYYGEEWQPQNSSPANYYKSQKLKYWLNYDAINQCFTYAKEYGKSLGRDIRCMEATHTLINYAQWHVVSPECSLASLPCLDGYVSQTWTGTSREFNYYNGDYRERCFETAYLEFGCMESMTAPTGRRVYFLSDPIEDNIKDWDDYKNNYEALIAAQLLYPKNNYYQVIPWPQRVYEVKYPVGPDSDEEDYISRSYSTQIGIMYDMFEKMPLSDNKVSGSNGISVVMANSIMFQGVARDVPTKPSLQTNVSEFIALDRTHEEMTETNDPQISNFFGLVNPFIKRGVPVHFVHMENMQYPDTWKDVKVLLMSYSNQKPMEEAQHTYIANWVKDGGILVYASRDNDPFQGVPEWWNTGDNHYDKPVNHLFELLGVPKDAEEGTYDCGKGKVCVIRQNPKEMVYYKGGDKTLVEKVKQLYDSTGEPLEFKNSFYLERGPYTIISVIDEYEDTTPYIAEGLYVDLFDPKLPVITKKVVNPGKRALLFDLRKIDHKRKPQIIAAASRAYDEVVKGRNYTFNVKGPYNTTNAMRIYLPSEPKAITVSRGGTPVEFTSGWDAASKTMFMEFENHHDGIDVSIKY